MINQCLWVLVAALVRLSIQRCTVEDFEANRVHDLVHSSETSEITHNITIREIVYNCLATSHTIGIFSSMSVSILYNRSDTPEKLRNVRYDIFCTGGTWLRVRQVADVFMGNDTRIDCSNCWAGNESDRDHHCTRQLHAVIYFDTYTDTRAHTCIHITCLHACIVYTWLNAAAFISSRGHQLLPNLVHFT